MLFDWEIIKSLHTPHYEKIAAGNIFQSALIDLWWKVYIDAKISD